LRPSPAAPGGSCSPSLLPLSYATDRVLTYAVRRLNVVGARQVQIILDVELCARNPQILNAADESIAHAQIPSYPAFYTHTDAKKILLRKRSNLLIFIFTRQNGRKKYNGFTGVFGIYVLT